MKGQHLYSRTWN